MDARERVNQYDNPQFMTVKAALQAELIAMEAEVFGVGGSGGRHSAMRLPGCPPSRLTHLNYFLAM